MALEFMDFLLRNKLVIIFYLAVVLFVFSNRKRFEFQAKIIALYKTNWGISLMDILANRFRRLIKIFGYVSIGLGFAGMFFIVFVLFQSLYTLLTKPDAPPALMPILPGVHVPGVPEALFIPLIQGVIAILIVAVIHEFSHGVVARAHNVKVKRTGLAIIGPFFAAFVEPDEKQLKKKSDAVNYSIIAAGSASNMVTFLLIFLVLLPAVLIASASVYNTPTGFSFSYVTETSPAATAGLKTDVVYTMIDNNQVTSVQGFLDAFGRLKPDQTVTLSTATENFPVIIGSNPENATKPYLGVNLYNRFAGDENLTFKIISWFTKLISLVGVLSLGIGIANLIPIGPLDGGKMMQKLLHKLRGEKKGNKTLINLSLFLFVIILILLTPIFRETFKLFF